MIKDLSCFSLKHIFKKLNSINISINLRYSSPFPKPKEQMLSWYSYVNRKVKIFSNGYFNKARLVTSLIDFSFIRSLVADAYSREGGRCFDPVSLFLCDIFRFIEGLPSMKEFCNILSHRFSGHPYRTYAGISEQRISCEADFSNFRTRIGENRYNAIFHILVEILIQLDIITARILSHDGTLVPTFARYRGCNYACQDCKHIPLNRDLISEIRRKILKLLQNPENIPIGKEKRAFVKCPKRDSLPKDVNPPSIEIIAYKLVPFNPELLNEKDQTAKLLGIEEELSKANLMLLPLRSNISGVKLDLENNPFYVHCPKVPADLDARIGYRRSKYNPNKKEKVFGFKVVITTSIEPEVGIELPVACISTPASDSDGSYFISSRFQIKFNRPTLNTYIDIGDTGFDHIPNYNYSRSEDSIPIFDYNIRNEHLSQDVLFNRGYDHNGWPFAPCKATCRPNGYDKEDKRLSFVCAKQCLSSHSGRVPEPIPDCQYLFRPLGFSTHMPIADNPRLLCEIPRGSSRWKKIRNLRPASERTNSTAKSDLDILHHPRVMGKERFGILAQLSCIVVLLKRFVSFVARITLSLRKLIYSRSQKAYENLQLKKIPPWLSRLIQRK